MIKNKAMNKHCEQCSTVIDKEKRGDSRFCSRECQNRFNYIQRKGGLNGLKFDQEKSPKKEEQEKSKPIEELLKGITDFPENEETELKTTNTTPSIDADFFNELMGQTMSDKQNNLTGEEDEEKDLEYEQEDETSETVDTPENVLPEQYITKKIEAENPLYSIYQKWLNKHQESKQNLEQEFVRLEAELKFQEGRNGNDLLAYGGLGAGLYGFLDNPTKKEPDAKEGDMTLKNSKGKIILRSKKKKWEKYKESKKVEEPSFLQRFGKALLYGAIGTGAGLVAKGVTEDWREKDKQQKITAIKKRMEVISKEYPKVLSGITETQKLLNGTPKDLITTKQVINPEYEKALSGLNEELNIKNNQMKKDNNKKPKRFKSNKIISAKEVGEQKHSALNFKGLWREFIGLPSLTFKLLVHGNSGEGKSTFCLWFARYLAENHGSVLYVSGEEGVNKTFHDKLKFCKAEVEDLHILDVRTAEEFMEEVNPNEFHFIILDSLHNMGIDAKKMKIIFERYKNTAFICIDQNNKKGDLLGANEKKHEVDTVVNVKNYIAETTKNRWIPKGVGFKTSDFQDLSKAKEIIEKAKRNGNNKGGNDLDSDRKGIV